jgi:hypothetical protein
MESRRAATKAVSTTTVSETADSAATGARAAAKRSIRSSAASNRATWLSISSDSDPFVMLTLSIPPSARFNVVHGPRSSMNRGTTPPQAACNDAQPPQAACNDGRTLRLPWPSVIVHGPDHVKFALRPGMPVVLLSAPGAALSAGCQWWRALVDAGRSAYPETPCSDILDCADAPGLAMAALRLGQRRLVLWPSCPAYAAVSAAAVAIGAEVLPQAPAALDLSARGTLRMLDAHLLNRTLS